jgi:hypothetical protein
VKKIKDEGIMKRTMKPIVQIIIAVLAIVFFLPACRKSATPTPASTLSPAITQAQKDTLQKYGTVFNTGPTPPLVSGTFFLDPGVFLYDNSGLHLVGLTGDSYAYKFSSQNNSKLTVSVAFRNVSTLETDETGADSTASYISGSGQLFSIYARITGSVSGVNYGALQVISGEVTSAGIADMQVTSEILSKDGDAGNELLYPVGTINIVYDGDKLSVPYTGTITLNTIIPKALGMTDVHVPGRAMLFVK